MHGQKKSGPFFSEEQLWNAFKEGDQDAYEQIFRENYQYLIAYGVRIDPDREEVKDCIQQLFFRIWVSRERLGDTSSIRSYLTASLRRMLLRRLRSVSWHTDIHAAELTFSLERSAEMKRIEAQDERDRVALLEKLLDKLPPRQKEAIYLKYYGEHSFEEISEIMDITTRAVYKLIYKALDNLSAELLAKNIKLHHLFSFIGAL